MAEHPHEQSLAEMLGPRRDISDEAAKRMIVSAFDATPQRLLLFVNGEYNLPHTD